MKHKILTLVSLIILTSGCISSPWSQSSSTPVTTPTSPLPSFQPGIWDKAVIRPPNDLQEDRTQPPFMFEIDLNSSHGFESKYLEHGTFGKPVFVISRNKSANIILSVSSLSNHTFQIDFDTIDGLPYGVTAKLEPELLALQPNETAKLKLNITVDSTTPTSIAESAKPMPQEFIGLLLKGDGWSVGRAFHLKII